MFSSAVARKMKQGDMRAAERLGLELADRLIGEGADKILAEAKAQNA